MSDEKKQRQYGVRIVKEQGPVAKAETPTQLSEKELRNASMWLTPPVDLRGLKALATNSTILPQCIRAYKNNIAGFGMKRRKCRRSSPAWRK